MFALGLVCFAPSLVGGLFVGVIVWFCSSNCCIICVCLDRFGFGLMMFSLWVAV